MGIIINQSIRNAIISYLGIIIGFISTIILFPNILGPEKFGFTRVLLAISTISVQVLNFGIPSSIVRFFPVLSEQTRHPKGLFWAFTIPPLIGFIIYIILTLFFKETVLSWYESDKDLLSRYYIYIYPMVFFLSSFGLLMAFVKANFNTVFASFLQDIFLRVVVIVGLLLFYFELINFDQFILLFVFNYALQYVLLLIYSLKKEYLSIKPVFKVFNLQKIKEISIYSFFALFSGLTMIIIGNIDLIMVSTYEGLSKSGIYAIALYVGAVITISKKSITKISFPVITSSFKNNDLENISKVYKQTSTNQFLIGLLIYVGVLANIKNLYAMLPPEYADGGIVIMIIGLANLFDMITGANGQIIISSKYYRFDFYSSCILLASAIVLNFLLIPRYGLIGASLATAFSIFISNVIRITYVWIRFKMLPFSFRLISISLCGLAVFWISFIIPELENFYIDLIIRSALISFLYLACIRIFNLSKEANEIITKLFERFGFKS